MGALGFDLADEFFCFGVEFGFGFEVEAGGEEEVEEEDVPLELVFEGEGEEVALIGVDFEFFEDFDDGLFVLEEVEVEFVGGVFLDAEEGLVVVFVGGVGEVESEAIFVL